MQIKQLIDKSLEGLPSVICMLKTMSTLQRLQKLCRPTAQWGPSYLKGKRSQDKGTTGDTEDRPPAYNIAIDKYGAGCDQNGSAYDNPGFESETITKL